jgi:hypothetical protein
MRLVTFQSIIAVILLLSSNAEMGRQKAMGFPVVLYYSETRALTLRGEDDAEENIWI